MVFILPVVRGQEKGCDITAVDGCNKGGREERRMKIALRKRYYTGIQIADVINNYVDSSETIMKCLKAFGNLECDDAVEVVRCKDCKEYMPWNGSNICGRFGSYYGATKPNDFCSYGERSEE